MSDYGDYDFARTHLSNSSVIVQIDMDSFEWQVYTRGRYQRVPQYDGRPGVIVNSSHKILAVSKQAKERGVTRSMYLYYARQICPQLAVYQKPDVFGKPEARSCRRASQDIKRLIFQMAQSMRRVIVEAYTDEIWLDVTEHVTSLIQSGQHIRNLVDEVAASATELTLVLETRKSMARENTISFRINQVHPHSRNAYEDENRLLFGAKIAANFLDEITRQLNYHASAGVSHNRLLAKLACNRHKPNTITVLPLAGIRRFSKRIEIPDIPTLGGGLGNELMQRFRISTMFDLRKISIGKLNRFYKYETCLRIFNLSHGISNEPVVPRKFSDTLSTALTFNNYSRHPPINFEELLNWFDPMFLSGDLAEKLNEEYADNNRIPVLLKIFINRRMIGEINLQHLQFDVGALDIYNLVRPVLVANNPGNESVREIRLTVPSFMTLH